MKAGFGGCCTGVRSSSSYSWGGGHKISLACGGSELACGGLSKQALESHSFAGPIETFRHRHRDTTGISPHPRSQPPCRILPWIAIPTKGPLPNPKVSCPHSPVPHTCCSLSSIARGASCHGPPFVRALPLRPCTINLDVDIIAPNLICIVLNHEFNR